MAKLADEIMDELRKKKSAPPAAAMADEEEGEAEEEEGGDEETVFAELADAIKSGDNEGGAAALKSFIKICGLE